MIRIFRRLHIISGLNYRAHRLILLHCKNKRSPLPFHIVETLRSHIATIRENKNKK